MLACSDTLPYLIFKSYSFTDILCMHPSAGLCHHDQALADLPARNFVLTQDPACPSGQGFAAGLCQPLFFFSCSLMDCCPHGRASRSTAIATFHALLCRMPISNCITGLCHWCCNVCYRLPKIWTRSTLCTTQAQHDLGHESQELVHR